MPKLKLVKYPDPLLDRKTTSVKNPTDLKIKKIVAEMIEVMHQENGMGLAANQVGQSLRLCVIEEKSKDKIHVFINPKITVFSKEKSIIEEGCLSFPGEFYSIIRPEKIQVRYLNEYGEKIKLKADGILARAIQHEVDHLDGIVFTKRLKKKTGAKRKNYEQ